jgi:hypothetical protein
MDDQFDRSREDVGNAIALEHVNTTMPDQQLGFLFYVTGLGLTRDPYLSTGLDNMWINVGRSQFHLPTRPAQVLRGHTAIVMPGRAALLQRLAKVRDRLAGTRFAVSEGEDHVEAVSPWGNRIRCFEPDEQRFGRMQLGMPYVEFDVPAGTAAGIARFYAQVIKAPAAVEDGGRCARVAVGNRQALLFRETDRPLPEYDGHHIQIYIADFSGPHRWLKERGLVSAENSRFQYRFQDIVDPDNGKRLHVLEHEVRSLTHPLYGRSLVNRDPLQTSRNYAPGHDAAAPEMGRRASAVG